MRNNNSTDLTHFVNTRIKVNIKEKGSAIGTLIGFDAYMNMVLEDVTTDYNNDAALLMIRGDAIENFLAHK